jgi:hypothetical protein
MTLHEAMVIVLRENGGWMDRDDLAHEIAARGLYRRRDGSQADGDQMRLRARRPKYAHLFVCSDSRCTRIRLQRQR